MATKYARREEPDEDDNEFDWRALFEGIKPGAVYSVPIYEKMVENRFRQEIGKRAARYGYRVKLLGLTSDRRVKFRAWPLADAENQQQAAD